MACHLIIDLNIEQMRNTSELIARIIKLLNDDFSVYIERQSSKILAIPDSELIYNLMDLDDDTYEAMYTQVMDHPDDYYKVEHLNSREMYNVMMDFALEQERHESVRLVKALRTNRPSDSFNKELQKLGSTSISSWHTYYNDRLFRILRSRLCQQHIHLLSGKCN